MLYYFYYSCYYLRVYGKFLYNIRFKKKYTVHLRIHCSNFVSSTCVHTYKGNVSGKIRQVTKQPLYLGCMIKNFCLYSFLSSTFYFWLWKQHNKSIASLVNPAASETCLRLSGRVEVNSHLSEPFVWKGRINGKGRRVIRNGSFRYGGWKEENLDNLQFVLNSYSLFGFFDGLSQRSSNLAVQWNR